jgi:signal transduction histidine kinase
MKLQVKLALYNFLTKLAIILFTGLLILFSLERISYHHTALRLQAKKNELLSHLSSKEISHILSQQQSFINYNILKEEYIIIKPIKYDPYLQGKESFSTEPRTIEEGTETYRILTSTFNFNQHSYLLEIGETIDAVEELKSTIKGFTLLMLFIALSLSLLIDLTFTRYLLSPFYKIIDKKLIKVNDPMNFDYEKVKTTTQDFNLLDDSISSLMKKITDMFILEKQFIANVSHELLTPISIISSRLENILQKEKLTEESENKIFASLKTLNRLKSIINSLLLISQIENNQFNKSDLVNISDIIKEVYDELDDRLEDKEIRFLNHIHHSWSMQANRSLIYTLLFNIINNAIKYNRVQGGIIISDELKGETYTLQIIDTGIGMDEKEIEKAFNRFEKFDADEKESYGLGLAIVKSITAFHDISVRITSAMDKGTTFKLVFKQQ